MGILSQLLVSLGLLAFVAAGAENCTFEQITPSKRLTWCPCEDVFFCARLPVPLDYQNPRLGRASVPLIKYPAVPNSPDGPYQGMILINPGGPGASGVNEARDNASTIQSLIGTNWDVVGFDARGMWLSEPSASCQLTNTTSGHRLTLRSKSVPKVTDEFYNSYIEFGKELGQRCKTSIGGNKDAGPHMTTAFTARDMLSVVDAFAETDDGRRAAKRRGLLNYYGISYGTFLGQTFASMFPERVGNMILDGVVSPESYLTNYTSASVNHLDGIIAVFFIYCHAAGPSACSYYTGSTPKDIYERFHRSFVQLNPRKAEAAHWSNATDLEAGLLTLKVTLLTAAGAPLSVFGRLPEIFQGLEAALAAQDVRPWTAQLATIVGDPGPAGYADMHPEWSLGTLCSDQDGKLYGKKLRDLRPLINDLEEQSIIGEIWIKSVLGCTGWPIKSNDVFTGPFGGRTATPILFVGNTYDPVTPIENALSSAQKYKNAQVLAIDAMGHTVAATNNFCAFAKMRAYLQATQMPGNDSLCLLAQGPFGITLNGTLEKNIMHAGLSDLVHFVE